MWGMQAGSCTTAGDAVGQPWQACCRLPTVATLALVGVAGQHPARPLILQVCPRYIPPRRLVLPACGGVGGAREAVSTRVGQPQKAQHSAADRHVEAAWPAPAAPSSTAAAALLLLRLVAAAAPAAAAARLAAAAVLVPLIATARRACRWDDAA